MAKARGDVARRVRSCDWRERQIAHHEIRHEICVQRLRKLLPLVATVQFMTILIPKQKTVR
jgi:hypothetical protein